MGDEMHYRIDEGELKVPIIGGNGGLTLKEREGGYKMLSKVAESLGVEIESAHFAPVEQKGQNTIYEFSAEIKKSE